MIDINSESFRRATEICSRLKIQELLPAVDYTNSRLLFTDKGKRKILCCFCPRRGQTNSRDRRKTRRMIKSTEGTIAHA